MSMEPSIHCLYDTLMDPELLTPHPRNPNKHPDKQIQALTAFIRRSGWRHPIVVSKESGLIVAGHARRIAAIAIGCQAPVVVQAFSSDAEEIAMLLADNRLAELAVADGTVLAQQIEYLEVQEYPIEILGFEKEKQADLSFSLPDGEAPKTSKITFQFGSPAKAGFVYEALEGFEGKSAGEKLLCALGYYDGQS